MGKEFDSEPVYNKRILKIKIKSSGDEAEDFHNKEIPKVGSNYTFLAIIDFVHKKDENCYPKVFLKECNYIEKENIVIRHTVDNLGSFSDESDE